MVSGARSFERSLVDAMKICVLCSSYEGSSSVLKNLDPTQDPSPWLRGHQVELVSIIKAQAERQLEALASQGFDVFINLCDGAANEDLAGWEVVDKLERLNVPFTGSGSDCYEPDKVSVKKHLLRATIPTPAFVLAQSDSDVDRAARSLLYPLIVKQHNGYGSLGMTKRSRVEDGTALRREVALMCDAFGEALIEEFVEGEELTVLVVEDPDDRFHPRALRPAMYQFPPGETFKHQSVKWDLGAQGQFVPCQDEALSAKLKQIGQRIFTLLGLRGYARCDFRVDRSGVPQFLECNPNCGIFYPEETWGCADAILASDPLGHRGMLDLMIRGALARHSEPESARRRAPPDIAIAR